MKDIFKNIEGREWDWFGMKESCKFSSAIDNNELLCMTCLKEFSLADLLANKSWCKTVWGEGIYEMYSIFKEVRMWEIKSMRAFEYLQREGEEACIEFIKETMV